MKKMPDLPIENVLPELLDTFNHKSNVVLVAPPGAGKTTGVPLALLKESWLSDKRIIMLEPRRLAAKNAAFWMASLLNEPVGKTIGYRIKQESKLSKETRIEVVTEGVLIRLIQDDIALENYALVIFDEFHERSLQADLGLALCLDVQENLNETLKILVMSATLDAEPVAAILHGAPIIQSEGRQYPVEIRYSNNAGFEKRKIDNIMVQTILSSLNKQEGSMLIFLPGVSEIHRMMTLVKQRITDENINLYPLYSKLSQSDQEKAIAACRKNEIKIVFATSIAETSITINGITVVIDAGLVRQPRFNIATAMNRLETVRISKAAADQRCGRAGRTSPGICYRLWTESEHGGLLANNVVEMNHADLSNFALELAQWGVSDPMTLFWIDSPPEVAFKQAQVLLQNLSALDDHNCITPQGRIMSGMPLHPRLSHMILQAKTEGFAAIACDVASILNEQDYFRLSRNEFDVDLSHRVELLREKGSTASYVDKTSQRRVLQSANQLRKQLKINGDAKSELPFLGVALAFAYPDRIAKQRAGDMHRYQLSNGSGVQLNEQDALVGSDYLVVASLGHSNRTLNRESVVYLAAKIEYQEIEQYFSMLINISDSVKWDTKSKSVSCLREQTLLKLVLNRKRINDVSPDKIALALLSGIRDIGISCLPWNKQTRSLQQRNYFLKQANSEKMWPDFSDKILLATLENWLLPYINGLKKIDDLKSLNLREILNSSLDWQQQKMLDQLAPESYKVPSGSRIMIDYQQWEKPVLAVKIQELFGLNDTPVINNGKSPLVLHLLSPARRPIQVTADLNNFWANTYGEVKKDLKGRYPKHFWPDNPAEAQATQYTKKKMR